MRVTPHGAFGYVRDDPASGLCSRGVYPCIHQGVDLAAPNEYVYAPEPLRVWIAANRNDLRPFSRYGPAFIWAEGLDSGLWHLFAHLEPGSIRTAGDISWSAASPDFDDYTETNILVLGERYDVPEGMIIARTDPGKRHLHWEVRTGVRHAGDASTAIGRKWQHDVTQAIRRDPMVWLKTGRPGKSIPGLPSQVHTDSGDDGVALLLVLGFFLWDSWNR